MNIAVIGLGSMGKRRIELIHDMYQDFFIIGIDNREDRREEAKAAYDIPVFSSFTDVSIPVDCVFVCTAPLSHAAIIKESLNRNCHVFTELNLIDDGYKDNMTLAEEHNCVLFLSSPFLYREEIQYIRAKVTKEKCWNYIYHIGQYLPDWHPWENYKDFFVRDRRTSGCREIMSIELPWLTRTFGDVIKSHVAANKMSGLDIDYNDNYMVQLTHENGNKGIFVVDIVSPVAERKLEVYSEGEYISWNGTPESLQEFDLAAKALKPVPLYEKTEHKKGYSPIVVENMYRNEIRTFFMAVSKGEVPEYGFAEDQVVMNLIESLGV